MGAGAGRPEENQGSAGRPRCVVGRKGEVVPWSAVGIGAPLIRVRGPTSVGDAVGDAFDLVRRITRFRNAPGGRVGQMTHVLWGRSVDGLSSLLEIVCSDPYYQVIEPTNVWGNGTRQGYRGGWDAYLLLLPRGRRDCLHGSPPSMSVSGTSAAISSIPSTIEPSLKIPRFSIKRAPIAAAPMSSCMPTRTPIPSGISRRFASSRSRHP